MAAKRIQVKRLGKGMTLVHQLGGEYPIKGVSVSGSEVIVDCIYNGVEVPVPLKAEDYVWVLDVVTPANCPNRENHMKTPSACPHCDFDPLAGPARTRPTDALCGGEREAPSAQFPSSRALGALPPTRCPPRLERGPKPRFQPSQRGPRSSS